MYYVLLVICAIAWGIFTGLAIKNTILGMVVSGFGAYAIANIFQHYGLI